MSYFAWLLLMALCGWIAGQIVGGKGRGSVTDILLGITGALMVRFSFDVLRVTVPDSNALVFSVCGAAALPTSLRFFMKRRDRSVSPRESQTSPVVKGRVIRMPRVRTAIGGHPGNRGMSERVKRESKGNDSSDSKK